MGGDDDKQDKVLARQQYITDVSMADAGVPFLPVDPSKHSLLSFRAVVSPVMVPLAHSST